MKCGIVKKFNVSRCVSVSNEIKLGFETLRFLAFLYFLDFHVSTRNCPTKQTIYVVIILGGLETCCLALKIEYYLMNWHFPVEDTPLAILQHTITLCLLWECNLAELNDIQEGIGHLLRSRKVSVLFKNSEILEAV